MLHVVTPEQAVETVLREFGGRRTGEEQVTLAAAAGRVLARPVAAAEFVPSFDRSTVDGWAVRAADTFGCSDSLPALLDMAGQVQMGENAAAPLSPGSGVKVPTGGAVPPGADAVVMVEYTEEYGDGTFGVLKPAAPGENLIYRGDDVAPGQEVLPAGRRIGPADIGALAALGAARVWVRRRPVVGILSTGDELVPLRQKPGPGQVRDVNAPMLAAAAAAWGARCLPPVLLPDREEQLEEAVDRLASRCDVVVLSGGSSVGEKDAAARVLDRLGEILFHGIAMKPGKPTLLARVREVPVLGLPGHPVAAFFTAHLLLRPLLAQLTGRRLEAIRATARLSGPVPANHGRAQYAGVFLRREEGELVAVPAHSKSGLITTLAGSDGYLCVPRDCEGFSAGQQVEVTLYSMD